MSKLKKKRVKTSLTCQVHHMHTVLAMVLKSYQTNGKSTANWTPNNCIGWRATCPCTIKGKREYDWISDQNYHIWLLGDSTDHLTCKDCVEDYLHWKPCSCDGINAREFRNTSTVPFYLCLVQRSCVLEDVFIVMGLLFRRHCSNFPVANHEKVGTLATFFPLSCPNSLTKMMNWFYFL